MRFSDNDSLLCSLRVTQNGDISRTAKFMSSPFVQTLASSMPFRVRIFQHGHLRELISALEILATLDKFEFEGRG